MLKQGRKDIIKVGVISDTHIPISAPSLPQALWDGLAGVDFIIHAGDLIHMSILKKLEKIAPVYAVFGNMDDREAKKALPEKMVAEISHFRIGIIHGGGKASDLHLRMRKEFQDVDVIIFGHSHQPFQEILDGILMFNPGSPTDKIFSEVNTFGILELNKEIKAKHIEI